MSRRMDVAKAYEKALFAGNRTETGSYFTDDIIREPGLGAADWGYEDVRRDWYEAEDRVIVELRERSWLKSDPKDVMDQRTCCILKFRSDRISEIRDYTDSHIYEEYLKRHRDELPKFKQR